MNRLRVGMGCNYALTIGEKSCGKFLGKSMSFFGRNVIFSVTGQLEVIIFPLVIFFALIFTKDFYLFSCWHRVSIPYRCSSFCNIQNKDTKKALLRRKNSPEAVLYHFKSYKNSRIIPQHMRHHSDPVISGKTVFTTP